MLLSALIELLEEEETPIDITVTEVFEEDRSAEKKLSPKKPQNTEQLVPSFAASLKFLRPCLVCGCRQYRYSTKGSLHCTTCQPHITGPAVYGSGRGFPSMIDQEKCHDGKQEELPRQARNNDLAIECFEIAYKWIQGNLEELLAAGWTRPELFRRSRHKWPIGNWGVAWLKVWKRKNLTIQLNPNNKILFTFDSGSKKVMQTAEKQPICARKRGSARLDEVC